MNLRRQLLIVSLLLLSLPWAGCQFVREIEGTLRKGQEASLQATAQSISAVLSDNPALLYPNTDRVSTAPDSRPSLYASPHRQAIFVDGYADGWEDVEPRRLTSELPGSKLAVSYRAVTRDQRLYLLLQVTDPQVIYHNPGLSREPNGDRLLLRTWRNNKRQDYVIATAAPGKVRAQYASPIDPGSSARSIRGQWQDSAEGYTLEIELPLTTTGGRLGFFIIDVTGKEGETPDMLGNITPIEMAAPPWLIYTPDALEQALAPFRGNGRHLDIIDKYNWLIADGSGSLDNIGREGTGETFWLLRLLYRSILKQEVLSPAALPTELGKAQRPEIEKALAGAPDNQRYRDPIYSNRTTLATASPIFDGDEVVGAVSIRQSSEEYLSLTDQAFNSLLGYSLAAMCTGVLGLLGYASILSWRIGALSRAAGEVVQHDGVILDNFPRSRARDEIGDLSRSYADLLHKLRQYNDYLRTLSQKLSHELRTPIAIIQTSLENLEQQSEKDIGDDIYLERAKGGLARLGKILNAMSEANGLEASIRSNKRTSLDLVPLVTEVLGAYKTVYPDHEVLMQCSTDQAMTTACPELLVQAMDKLMDNAASFCPPGGTITLQLEEQESHWKLAVSNEGPTLPKEMQGALFNSMVSIRDKDSEEVHLGLGLHIVQLIADFHGAELDIGNLENGSGVCCSIHLEKQA